MELLAFVVLACHRKAHWDGELVLYVTDNANVRSWLHKRRPSTRVASLLVRLVQRLKSEANFTVHPVYIRTYRNQLGSVEPTSKRSEHSSAQMAGRRPQRKSDGISFCRNQRVQLVPPPKPELGAALQSRRGTSAARAHRSSMHSCQPAASYAFGSGSCRSRPGKQCNGSLGEPPPW